MLLKLVLQLMMVVLLLFEMQLLLCFLLYASAGDFAKAIHLALIYSCMLHNSELHC